MFTWRSYMKTFVNIFVCLILIFALNTSFMIAQDTAMILQEEVQG